MKREQRTSHSDNFVYGFHTVNAVLRYQSERAKKLFIARKNESEEIIELAQANGILWEHVERAFLEKRFRVGSDAQGVVLQCSPYPYRALSDLLTKDVKRILVLDTWQDAMNIGRAARAALCFGAQAMIICKDRSAQINAASEKAAVGALSRILVARVVNLSTTLNALKDVGFFIYGADERADVSLERCDFAEKAAVVIGQEGEGLRTLTKKNCDLLVSIPMADKEICLNAADTALVILYELARASGIIGANNESPQSKK